MKPIATILCIFSLLLCPLLLFAQRDSSFQLAQTKKYVLEINSLLKTKQKVKKYESHIDEGMLIVITEGQNGRDSVKEKTEYHSYILTDRNGADISYIKNSNEVVIISDNDTSKATETSEFYYRKSILVYVKFSRYKEPTGRLTTQIEAYSNRQNDKQPTCNILLNEDENNRHFRSIECTKLLSQGYNELNSYLKKFK